MTIAQRRIEFIRSTRSDRWIARESGIPRSTIGYVRRGERVLSTDQQKLMRNVYQREAYSRMRDTGFSRTQARRYTWYATETTGRMLSEMKLVVDRFTAGAVGSQISKLRRAGLSYDEDALWKEMRQKVIEGLQRSKHPVEDFPDPDY